VLRRNAWEVAELHKQKLERDLYEGFPSEDVVKSQLWIP
jgi:hypothetical protein